MALGPKMRNSLQLCLFCALLMLGAPRSWSSELFAQVSGCATCHNIDRPTVGPSYLDIANRYRGNSQARARLFDTVKFGGKGNWSTISKGVPMPHYGPVLKDSEIKMLVDWILSLENG